MCQPQHPSSSWSWVTKQRSFLLFQPVSPNFPGVYGTMFSHQTGQGVGIIFYFIELIEGHVPDISVCDTVLYVCDLQISKTSVWKRHTAVMQPALFFPFLQWFDLHSQPHCFCWGLYVGTGATSTTTLLSSFFGVWIYLEALSQKKNLGYHLKNFLTCFNQSINFLGNYSWLLSISNQI